MVIARRRRRRRRPAWVLVAAVLSILVLAVNAAASSGPRDTERRIATLAYLDEVRPEIERSTRQGADLTDLRARAAELGRAKLGRRLDQVTADAKRGLRIIEGIEPPRHLRTAHSLLIATFAIRARSAESLQRTITKALDPRSPPPASGQVVVVFEDLLAADRSYRVFLDSLPKSRETLMPQSRWHAGPALTEPEASALIASLRSSASLQPVRDVAVVLVTTDPAPVANEGEASVLPTVPTLKLHVVVANVGNDPVRRVTVLATVTGPAGEVDTARQFVDLGPGQKSTVTIGGLRMQPGGASSLSVTAGPIEGEGNLFDNENRKTLVLR